MDFLERGVRRFKQREFRRHRALFRRLARNQSPRVLFITCADSRVVPDLITQSRPGDLFAERNPGNIVPVYSGKRNSGTSASIEYAVDVLKVSHIVVCGHSDCGAVKAMLHPEKLSAIPAVRRWLTYGNRSRRLLETLAKGWPDARRLELLTRLNIMVQLEHLVTHPCVIRRVRERRLEMHGWLYRIEEGEILQLDAYSGEFHPWP